MFKTLIGYVTSNIVPKFIPPIVQTWGTTIGGLLINYISYM